MNSCFTLIETHRMGDAVMALPLITGAQKAGMRPTVAASPAAAEIFKLVIDEADLCLLDEHSWLSNCRTLHAARKKWGSPCAATVWADPRLHALQRASGFARRIGYPACQVNCYAREAALLRPYTHVIAAAQRILDKTGPPLLTDPLFRDTEDESHHASLARMAKVLGVGPDYSGDWTRAVCPREAICFEGSWLLHPGAGSPWKLWSNAAWSELAQRMKSELGLRPVMVRSVGQPEPPWDGAVWTPGSVSDLVGGIASADGLVALDSLPAHLAGAAGTPLVTLFGHMRGCWFTPFGKIAHVVHTPHPWPILRSDLSALGGSLLKDVTVDMVLSPIESIISRPAPHRKQT